MLHNVLGTLHHGATLCAEAKGIFVGMRPEIFAKLVEIRKANQIPATELTREQVTETVLAFCELFRPVPSIQDNLNVLESCSRYHFHQGILCPPFSKLHDSSFPRVSCPCGTTLMYILRNFSSFIN
jgi:hypothetical protein